MSRILVISANESRRNNLTTVISFLGDAAEGVGYEQAFDTLQREASLDAVLIDSESVELSSDVIEKFPAFAFIAVGSSDKLTSVPNVMGLLEEPITYPVLTKLLHRCQEYVKRKPGQNKSTQKTKLFRSLVGKSQEIQNVRRMIEQVAPTDANVLVLGESGTGKEVVARNVHFLSKRKDGPFIPVNCGAIPGELLESELFGHEKGAFTGAVSSRKGRFELAEGGTLFLDEIGDMPLQMQVKLLRVLQERTYERVGGTKPIPCNVRIVAATHRNLEGMIEDGKFREDLFYRLNVFPIDSPALRERKEDIPLLMQELVSRFENESAKSIKFTEEALASCMEHKWAGNVRELSNLVERLIILCPNQVVDVKDLPHKYQHIQVEDFNPEYPEELLEREALNSLFSDDGDDFEDENDGHSQAEVTRYVEPDLPAEGVNLKEYLSDLEVNMITQALDQHDWVVARSAEFLGMRRTTLVEKMRKYNIAK